jgi:AraC-like DNA-binding protein
MPVRGKAVDYPPAHIVEFHSHPTHQLIYAIQGVITVFADKGQWIVPPSRGLWMPAHTAHQLRTLGEVRLRTVYIRPDAASSLPSQCQVIAISSLLRELILAAIDISSPYSPDSRDGRLMQLLLDELRMVPSLPLVVPQPTDMDLVTICDAIRRNPADESTLAQWAEQLQVNPKTIQRRFARQTGMTFGQWRQQVRLILALEQLASGAKIVDVALNLGYSTPSAFATMFKRQFGVAPSAYFR